MALFDQIKPDPYRAPDMAAIERGREMYAHGFTVSRCLAATGMSLGTFYYWLDGGPRADGKPLLPPLARRRTVAGKRRKPLAVADRVSLIARLNRTAARQALDIERRLAKPSAAAPERERDVRMLHTLVRTLRELAAFDSHLAALQGEGETPALADARRRLNSEALVREAEERRSIARSLIGYLAEMRKIAFLHDERAAKSARAEQARARQAEEEEALRAKLTRQIEGLVAAQRQAEAEGAA